MANWYFFVLALLSGLLLFGFTQMARAEERSNASKIAAGRSDIYLSPPRTEPRETSPGSL